MSEKLLIYGKLLLSLNTKHSYTLFKVIVLSLSSLVRNSAIDSVKLSFTSSSKDFKNSSTKGSQFVSVGFGFFSLTVKQPSSFHKLLLFLLKTYFLV
jgi:hypothetical protein